MAEEEEEQKSATVTGVIFTAAAYSTFDGKPLKN